MKNELEHILEVVSDDSLAISFQTLGGYRTHLKEVINMLLFSEKEGNKCDPINDKL